MSDFQKQFPETPPVSPIAYAFFILIPLFSVGVMRRPKHKEVRNAEQF